MRWRRTQTDLPGSGPLRVAWLVTPLSPFGGTYTHLRRWCERLDPACVRPTLYYYSREEAHGAHLPALVQRRADGCSVPVPMRPLEKLDLSRRQPIEALRGILEALGEDPPELLHTLFIGADLVGLLASLPLRLPILSSVEGALLVDHLPVTTRHVLAMLYRRLSSRFAAITAVSSRTAEELEPLLSRSAPSVMVLPPGVPEAPRHPSPAGGPHLVAVGRIAPIKGLPLLVEALERLSPRLPGLRLTVVGDGPDRDPFLALVRSRRLEARISVTGWCSEAEVADHLERAHLLVMPSYHEGLPWSALEAMSRGVPVLASAVGGLPELLAPDVHGPVGALVEPNRSDRLTQALAALLERPDWRAHLETLGARAQVRVRERHSVAAEAAALTELYRRVRRSG